MKAIAAPIVGGMITSTIHVLILVPVFFAIGTDAVFAKNWNETREHDWRIGVDTI
jgi:Cu(I)/Ag(I) efflux system membrane protein CusA/SilA